MRTHTILREFVSDRKKAHRLRQHCRCWIDTKRNCMVSCHAAGHEPGAKIILRQMAAEAKTQREHAAMTCALMSIAHALAELRAEGVIGSAVPVRVLHEANKIIQDARCK